MAADFPVSLVALRALPIFESLPDDRLEAIARRARLRHARKGEVILHAGDHTDNLYIILSGTLRVLVSDEEGREAILSILHQGELFGEMGVIDDHPRSATVMAIEPVELVVIAKSDFRLTLEENFDLALYIMRSLVKRLRQADRKIESLALMDVYGRVARLLLDMAVDVDGRLCVNPNPSRQDMAKMVGASREMVSRVMRDLQADGLIDETDGFVVLSQDAVKRWGPIGDEGLEPIVAG